MNSSGGEHLFDNTTASVNLPSQIIGATYTLTSCIGLLVNIVVGVAIYRSGLLSRGANTVFILAMVAISDGIIRLSSFAFYYGPSIMLQRNLGDNGRFGPVSFYNTLLMFASFGMGSVTELAIAVNRFLTIKQVVIDANYSDEGIGGLFTRRNTLFYAGSIFPALLIAYFILFAMTPCCKPYFTHEFYSIIFDQPPGAINYFFDYFQRVLAATCTFVSVALYVAVFAILLRANRELANLDEATQAKRRKEAYYCLQFAAAYVFYFALWMMFEAIPYLPHDPPYWFSLEIYSAIVDCFTTALIQGILNSRVRGELARMFCSRFKFGVASSVRVMPETTMPLSQTLRHLDAAQYPTIVHGSVAYQ